MTHAEKLKDREEWAVDRALNALADAREHYRTRGWKTPPGMEKAFEAVDEWTAAWDAYVEAEYGREAS